MNLWKKGLALGLILCITAGMTMTSGAESASIPIDSSTFPDPAFLLWVQQSDTDADGFLSQAERDAVTKMDLRKMGIRDLSGLEWFRGLEKLNCSENDLVSLELRDFPALTSLTCNENPRLSNLVLDGVPALEHLYCFQSNLSQLDLHGVPNLAYLAWGASPLEELDLSGNPNLNTLHVLGGNLTRADLSHNEKLDTVLWNHTWIETLDLSYHPNLTYLNCTDNQLTSLDLSGNEKLEAVYAGNNQLLAVRMPEGSAPFCDLTGQRSAAFQLSEGENGFWLSDLVPWMNAENVQIISGGTLDGTRVQLDSPNQTLTYRYTDESAVLEASLSVTGKNGWQIPLRIDNWTYGEPAASPQAQAAFGTVEFFYGPSPQGPFQKEPPTVAGTWYVQAKVEGTPQYSGLEQVVSFQIDPAVPEYPVPEHKWATYGDYLASVSLEPRFFWENESLRVGNAGEQMHLVCYVPEDVTDYQVVEHIRVFVTVMPYDGTLLSIPPITSRSEAENLVLKHEDWILKQGTDYVTAFEKEGENVRFTIYFQGNYQGTVIRTFLENSQTGTGNETGGGGSNSGGGSSTGGGDIRPTFSISAQATSGGMITPKGTLWVSRGETPRFTMRADEGFRLKTVLVDGEPVDREESYRFAPVSKNHTIWAEFVSRNVLPSPNETGVSKYLDTQAHNFYLSGYPGNRFGPDDSLTRAQAAQIFYSLLNDRNVPGGAGFSDVPSDAWYAKAVNALASLGKVSGVGENRFLPDQPITRAEFVTMAMGFADLTYHPAGSFPDVKPEAWYYQTVMSAAEYGWISGYPDGSFGPDRLVTRGQAAVVINRMLDRRADQDFISRHTQLHPFLDVPASHWAYYDICEAANSHHYIRSNWVEIWENLR
ncbi:S-layer homology domain-containing protein [Lawsonibacter sp. LCP25S3_G6]|uniref:S-layer homology domain-containing protein n=1 Tax=unclassified Lawsonibacter TaxID=2617946 RepID=UPI003F98036E